MNQILLSNLQSMNFDADLRLENNLFSWIFDVRLFYLQEC